jgi:hypothetical protein
MAVTIVQNPELYAPTYNEMVYTLTSTNSTQTSFKYIADIYINGSGTKSARLPIAPEPKTGSRYGIIKVNEIIENFLTYNIGDPSGVVGTTANDESILDYVVKFGESYEVAGVLTVFPDLTVDSSRYAWNGSVAYEDFVGFTYLDYFLQNQNDKFLTRSPSAINTMLTNSHWLYYMDDPAALLDYFNLITYNASGGVIGTWRIKNSLTSATTGEDLGKVTAGPQNINALPNTEFSVGVQPVFTGAEAYYTIQAVKTAAQESELKTFNIIDPCMFERWNVLFLNSLGGFDTFTFKLLSRDSTDIKRTMYKMNPDRLSSAGAYTYTLADKSTRKRVLNSDWITEDESEWLEDLLTSPVVYLEDTNNNLIAVDMLNTKWTKKTKVNDKLFNLQIELELNDNYRQRG